jgi:azurin
MKKITFLSTIATTIFLYSCGSNQTSETEVNEVSETVVEVVEHPTEFTIRAQGNTMPEMKFDTDKITVNAGKNITITLINEGDNETMMHNIAIIYNGYAEEVAMRGMMKKDTDYIDAEDAAVIANSPISGPGETVNVSFKIDQKGTYQFVCTYPGHWSKMLGTLIVE